MRDYDKFKQWLSGVLTLIWGTPNLTKKALDKEMSMMYTKQKPKRARGPKGRYKGDDKSTPNVNEAWVGGKAPKGTKKKRKK